MCHAASHGHEWWSELHDGWKFRFLRCAMTSGSAHFSDLRHHMRQLVRSPGAWSLVALVLAIQALVTLAGGHELQPARGWFDTFGLSRGGFLSGKLWQIGSYGLLHGGWWHVGLNAGFILLIGSRIEHMAGRGAMLKTVLGGVVCGGVAHLLLGGGGLLVGISGGCMALLLFLTTLSPESRMAPLPVSGRSLGLGILIAAGILALMDPAAGIPGFQDAGRWVVARGWGVWFQMGHACHLGGSLAGWVAGRWLLRPRVTLESLRRNRLRREAGEFR
jgi:membrane associated rhomboid family serine protease